MFLRSLDSAKIDQKKVLLRVDFNVPFAKDKILDDFRILNVLPTIKWLKEKKAAKIILVSHLGQPNGKDLKYSLKPVADYLEKTIKEKVYFLTLPIGNELLKEIDKLPFGSVILLENIRFYKEEQENDKNFAKDLAKMADCFINEAFSVSHRQVASLCAITEFLPFYPGKLLEKEISNLDRVSKNPAKPLVVILGGAKIKDKLPLIEKFLTKADYILLGGVMANTIVKSLDFSIGQSLFEEISQGINLSGFEGAELILPGDFVVLDKAGKKQVRELGKVLEKDMILDIGPIASHTFGKIISKAKTIFWNGPMGKFEDKRFKDGTNEIVKAIIKNKNAFSVIGGGETIASFKEVEPNIKTLETTSQIFFSTGGGASLEYLAGKSLPGLKALSNNK